MSLEKMPAVKKGLVSIVILNWNGKKLLQDCVESILKNTDYKNFEIIVSDNGSTDGSIEILQQLRKQGKVQKLVLNGKNLGFGGGNNAGILAAEGEYVFLLNNDTLVTKGWLAELVKAAEQNPAVGIIGPLFQNFDQQNISLGPGYVDDSGRSKDIVSEKELEGEMVSGGAFFVKRKVIEKIGLLDEKFFPIYFEDADYCARARKAGFGILFTPKSRIVHLESASTKKQPGKWMFLALNRNRVRYMLLHFSTKRIAKAFFWELARLGKNIASRRFLWLLESYWLNLRDLPDIAAKRKIYGSLAKEKGKKNILREKSLEKEFIAFGGSAAVQQIDGEWGKLAEKNGFFLTPEWMLPWIKAAEKGKTVSPWIAVAKEKGKISAIAPFALKGKELQFLGQDYSYNLGILAEDEDDAAGIADFVFANAEKWDRIFFRHLVDGQPLVREMQERCREQGFSFEAQQGDACSVVLLPDSMEKYFAGLKKKLRKNLRNDLSRLEREFKIETKVFSGSNGFEQNWKEFLGLHFENMERKGEKTVLAEEWFREICYKACRSAAAKGGLCFLQLLLDGKLAGSLLAVEHNGVFSVLNIGFGKEFAEGQSLGNVLFLKAIEYCCKKGIKELDLLGGSPEYKAKFGAVQRNGIELRVFKTGSSRIADSLKRNTKKIARAFLLSQKASGKKGFAKKALGRI